MEKERSSGSFLISVAVIASLAAVGFFVPDALLAVAGIFFAISIVMIIFASFYKPSAPKTDIPELRLTYASEPVAAPKEEVAPETGMLKTTFRSGPTNTSY